MRFCITQRGRAYQAGVSFRLWPITRVKQFGPTFNSFDACQAYIRAARPATREQQA
jgi:hypothetical protein